MIERFIHGRWIAEFDIQDGARINRLAYAGVDLITTKPDAFKAPKSNYGLYETRPVYGYDDCFPSVEQSIYPGSKWEIPDHGELCWLSWTKEIDGNQLIFSVESNELPCRFKRIVEFHESTLIWRFEVINSGKIALPFQHVIHPLIPLNNVTDIELPEFDSVHNEKGEELLTKSPCDVRNFLLNLRAGEFYMLFLQSVKHGRVGWTYNEKLKLEMIYPIDLFPTIGIWWNHSGYPDENECRRNECAFEPIPGRSSTLSEAWKEGLALLAVPETPLIWEIRWNVTFK